MTRRISGLEALSALVAFMSLTLVLAAQGQRGGRGGGQTAPPTAQTAASADLTGYWVRLVNEDWRMLMIVPPKGNADSIAMSPPR
jgi:hypothetical protein